MGEQGGDPEACCKCKTNLLEASRLCCEVVPPSQIVLQLYSKGQGRAEEWARMGLGVKREFTSYHNLAANLRSR
jgi:hypothetical protein